MIKQLRTEVQKRYAKTALQVLGATQETEKQMPVATQRAVRQVLRKTTMQDDRTTRPNRAITDLNLLRAKLLQHRR